MRRLVLEAGFTGIGVQQAGEKRFIHLDDIQPEDNFHVPPVYKKPPVASNKERRGRGVSGRQVASTALSAAVGHRGGVSFGQGAR